MSRNGSGVYSLPAGSTVANGDTSDSSDLNTPLADIEADLNVARPVVAGGTGATSASAARTALGLAIGTDVQAYDAGLASIAGLTTAADRMIYTTASDVYAVATLTAAGRAILDDADAAAQLVTLGAQPLDTDLTQIAAVTRARGTLLRGGAAAWEGVALGTSGQVLTSDGTDAVWAGGLAFTGPVATTSGTAVDLSTSVPENVRRITIMIRGVSQSSNGDFRVRIGSGGAYATTGYLSQAWSNNASFTSFTTGFGLTATTVAGDAFNGHVILTHIGSNNWVQSGTIAPASGANISTSAGQLTLAGTLDRVQIGVTGGFTFDAGQAAIMWEF